jgi:uncharacterized sulfatase
MPLSKQIRCFTEYLREAGYYCSNNVKEDYNFTTPTEAWDESSDKAHWRKRTPGQPFFSVFNLTMTHQSQTRYDRARLDEVSSGLPAEKRHDPETVFVPPYYPDTPLVRENLAALHTQITLMDQRVQEILDELEEDGLSENTIVFFYSDHGDGLPRGKRWLHDTGLRVPLIIRFPERYSHLAPSPPGTVTDRLTSFVDLAPTVLSLVQVKIPDYVQGKAFLGGAAESERDMVFAIRDRIDEVLETSRAVRDRRYKYIRNYLPHRPRMHRSFFAEITPIRQELRRLAASDELAGEAAWLMNPTKPAEELYDTQADPWEMRNLADSEVHSKVLDKMRQKLKSRMLETWDTGLLPEDELVTRFGGRPPFDSVGQLEVYPMERVLEVAELVGRGPEKMSELRAAMSASDSAVRYWAATGLGALGVAAKPAEDELKSALRDSSSAVRFAAAEALCNLDLDELAVPVLAEGLSEASILAQLHAAQILVAVGPKSRLAIPAMKNAVERSEGLQDHGWYLREALGALLVELEGAPDG